MSSSHKGVRQGIWAAPAVMKQLRALHEEGLSSSAIARVLTRDSGTYVTRNAVIGQLSRSGITDKSRSVHPSTAHTNASRRVLRKPRDDGIAAALFVPEPVEIAVTPLRIPMLELDHGHCRFPLWAESGADDGFLHCGLPKFGALSYCEGHARKAYQPAPKRRARNEREGRAG
jgi:GcrA cell cycle regulator